ncbi:hypothetical protein FA95DRAFT_1567869 [Auriscalpium vulgare]|uniref:Uncharacterized protein n=1 Tax=Auriscalpium vulgare TaxID=40419 RepID=A0ACB8R334_9AGAM|nr:hypothetical protein FA95DRAFT_1567869 [Auriscalpium vulgare]
MIGREALGPGRIHSPRQPAASNEFATLAPRTTSSIARLWLVVPMASTPTRLASRSHKHLVVAVVKSRMSILRDVFRDPQDILAVKSYIRPPNSSVSCFAMRAPRRTLHRDISSAPPLDHRRSEMCRADCEHDCNRGCPRYWHAPIAMREPPLRSASRESWLLLEFSHVRLSG